MTDQNLKATQCLNCHEINHFEMSDAEQPGSIGVCDRCGAEIGLQSSSLYIRCYCQKGLIALVPSEINDGTWYVCSSCGGEVAVVPPTSSKEIYSCRTCNKKTSIELPLGSFECDCGRKLRLTLDKARSASRVRCPGCGAIYTGINKLWDSACGCGPIEKSRQVPNRFDYSISGLKFEAALVQPQQHKAESKTSTERPSGNKGAVNRTERLAADANTQRSIGDSSNGILLGCEESDPEFIETIHNVLAQVVPQLEKGFGGYLSVRTFSRHGPGQFIGWSADAFFENQDLSPSTEGERGVVDYIKHLMSIWPDQDVNAIVVLARTDTRTFGRVPVLALYAKRRDEPALPPFRRLLAQIPILTTGKHQSSCDMLQGYDSAREIIIRQRSIVLTGGSNFRVVIEAKVLDGST